MPKENDFFQENQTPVPTQREQNHVLIGKLMGSSLILQCCYKNELCWSDDWLDDFLFLIFLLTPSEGVISCWSRCSI